MVDISDCGITLLLTMVCLISAFLWYQSRRPLLVPDLHVPGYILENQVTHARLLPATSTYAFTYPTISFFVSLDSLESRSLDLCRGWLFGYGGLWGRATGIRPKPYLASSNSPSTIREKLEAVLRDHEALDSQETFSDAWMLTMPSYFGFEGINPLTVYFVYKHDVNILCAVVLEIHNTFGESHVHVLLVGKEEDEEPAKTFDHQWTFRRSFHVSPFNDRSGFYKVSIRAPSLAPIAARSTLLEAPLPTVRVHLHTIDPTCPTTPGPLKLTAIIRPRVARPLTTQALMSALARTPFTLFLSMARILYGAYVLHYKKRLNVYIRPEPLPVASGWGTGTSFSPKKRMGGVKWLPEGLLERFSRHRTEAYLARRAEETGISITLLSSDPAVHPRWFTPSKSTRVDCQLTISYTSSRFFTILFMSPSPEHAWLLGSSTERLFFASSRELFLTIFALPPSRSIHTSQSLSQRIRMRYTPACLTYTIPSHHFLDEEISTIGSCAALFALHLLEQVERGAFTLLRARTVAGDEPWKQWDRAVAIYKGGRSLAEYRPLVGSVRDDD